MPSTRCLVAKTRPPRHPGRACAIARRAYTYDLTGNISQIQTETGTIAYQYDPLNHLTEVKPDAAQAQKGTPLEAYTYDALGNRLSSQSGTWQYNSENQLTGWHEGPTPHSLSYTETGHTASDTTPTQSTTYRYNGADRLSQIEQNGQTLARYQYDPLGRRASKTQNGLTTYYYYGENGLLTETDGQGKTLQAYAWRPNCQWCSDPVAQLQPSANQTLKEAPAYFIHTDHLQTPQLVTDASGNAMWQAQAEAFGKTQTQGNLAMPWRFPGQYADTESGLHYNGFRTYNPQTGRYLERDPLGLAAGVNVYGYVGGNPVMYVDSDGRLVTVVGGAIVGGLLGGLSSIVQTLRDPCFSGGGLDILWQGAKGAGVGALSGAAFGLGVPAVWGLTGGVVLGAGQGALNAFATGGDWKTQAVVGGVAGGLGGAAGLVSARAAYWGRLPVTSLGRREALDVAVQVGGTSGTVVSSAANLAGNLGVPSDLGGMNLGPKAQKQCECKK